MTRLISTFTFAPFIEVTVAALGATAAVPVLDIVMVLEINDAARRYFDDATQGRTRLALRGSDTPLDVAESYAIVRQRIVGAVSRRHDS